MEWDWTMAAVFVGGVAAGALVMYLLRNRVLDRDGLQRRVVELENEAEAYRAKVDEHFERTADLFQEVTEKYRSLHDHLAQGATGLARGARQLPSIELPDKLLADMGDDAGTVELPPRTPDAEPSAPAAEQVAQADTLDIVVPEARPAATDTGSRTDVPAEKAEPMVAEVEDGVRR